MLTHVRAFALSLAVPIILLGALTTPVGAQEPDDPDCSNIPETLTDDHPCYPPAEMHVWGNGTISISGTYPCYDIDPNHPALDDGKLFCPVLELDGEYDVNLYFPPPPTERSNPPRVCLRPRPDNPVGVNTGPCSYPGGMFRDYVWDFDFAWKEGTEGLKFDTADSEPGEFLLDVGNHCPHLPGEPSYDDCRWRIYFHPTNQMAQHPKEVL